MMNYKKMWKSDQLLISDRQMSQISNNVAVNSVIVKVYRNRINEIRDELEFLSKLNIQ